MRRRLVLALLAAVALVAGGCASGDDDATSGATGAVSVPTRAQLPVAPSTRVGLPTAPPTSAPAATTTTAPPDPTSVKVTAGSYATCPTRTKGQTFPAPLVVLGVDGTLKWTVCTLAAATATEPVDLGPTVGAVFVTNADGTRTFHAFGRDGTPAWAAPLPSTTLVADHAATAYAVSAGGAQPGTQALDAATGQPKWAAPGEEARAARPDAVVLLSQGSPQVVVRDPATGTGRWSQALASSTTSVGLAGDALVTSSGTPAGADGTPATMTIATWDLATGAQRWSRDVTNAGATAVVAGAILVWGTDDTTSALDPADGHQLWRRLGRPLSGPGGVGVAADGLAFLGQAAGDTDVRVVDLATGQAKWSAQAADLRQQALGAGTGLLLFYTSLRGVEAVDLASGAGRWTFDWPPATGSTTSGVSLSADLVLVAVGKA